MNSSSADYNSCRFMTDIDSWCTTTIHTQQTSKLSLIYQMSSHQESP